MKKTLVILNLVILSLFISGCGCSKKEEVKTVMCKLNKSFDDYNVNAEYKIQYYVKDDSVKNIEQQANFTSNNPDTLEFIKQLNSLDYEEYSKLNGGTYTANVGEESLDLYLYLDFEKINLETFINTYDSNQYYIVDDKINYKKYIEEFERDEFNCN